MSSLKFALEVTFYIVGWYASSIVSSNTTKQLLSTPIALEDGTQLRLRPLFLTSVELFLSAVCGFILIHVFRLATPRSLGDNTLAKDVAPVNLAVRSNTLRYRMWCLGLVFMGGFITLNLALNGMSVSLANTLRALEPIVSLFLSYFMLDKNSVNAKLVGAVVPIVVGAAMASYGNAEFTVFGFVVICVSNLCFALRAVLYKGIRQTFGLDNITMFFHVCQVGATASASILLCMDVLRSPLDEGPSNLAMLSALLFSTDLTTKGLVIVNGLTFFAYLQLSFVVLSKVSVVSHAVANAFRRPAVIVASVIHFKTEVSTVNALGVAMACFGVMLYSYVESLNKAAALAAKSQGKKSD